MDPIIGYGLISGIGSLGSSLFNQYAGLIQSKELMDYQYQLQQKAIDAQNLYNSPKEQMKRLAEAQLNPNLVYGSGVDGNQSSAASPGIVNRRGEMNNPAAIAPELYLQREQLNLQKQANYFNWRESTSRRYLNDAKTLGVLLDNEFNDRTMDSRIKEQAQTLVNKIQQQYNMEAQEAETWSRVRNLDNTLEQIWAQTDLLRSRTNLTDQQALTETVKRAYMRSNISVNNSKIRQIASFIEFIEAGTKLRGQQYDIQDMNAAVGKAWKEWRKAHPNADLTIEAVKEFLNAWQQANQAAGGTMQFLVP